MCLSSKDTSSGKVAVPLNAAPSSLKAQILLRLCWSLAVPPVPSWCSKHSVPQGHFRNWRNLVLEEKKKKKRGEGSVRGDTDDTPSPPQTRSLCDEDEGDILQ